MNKLQPVEARQSHQEALAIFRRLGDRQGIAETLDLLGLAGHMEGDLVAGADHYRQAITLFQELDDRQGLVSSLATLTLGGLTYETDTVVSAASSLSECARDGESALQLARDIGWRSGEAYALITLALCLGAQGDYQRALQMGQNAHAIATEIEHRQWMTFAHYALGALHYDLLAFEMAQHHFEAGLALARAVGSLHWIHNTTGYLASTCIMRGDLAQAESLLEAVFDRENPPRTLGQRRPFHAWAELALAQGDPSQALQITDQLIVSAANVKDTADCPIPRLAILRGEAFTALHRFAEAESALQAAHSAARTQGARPLLWRVHVALGKVYQAQRRRDDAKREYAAARDIIQVLAGSLPDEALQQGFLAAATALLPALPPPTPRQVAKRKYGGLTVREQEVAVLVAQGKSNRDIAEQLVVGERTVEGHVSNILNKLGFNSRTQIAAWAVEKELL